MNNFRVPQQDVKRGHRQVARKTNEIDRVLSWTKGVDEIHMYVLVYLRMVFHFHILGSTFIVCMVWIAGTIEYYLGTYILIKATYISFLIVSVTVLGVHLLLRSGTLSSGSSVAVVVMDSSTAIFGVSRIVALRSIEQNEQLDAWSCPCALVICACRPLLLKFPPHWWQFIKRSESHVMGVGSSKERVSLIWSWYFIQTWWENFILFRRVIVSSIWSLGSAK